MEDSVLIERFLRSGDLDAAEELLGRYEQELYNYLRQMLRHSQDSEDAMQEAFARALRALPKYREESHFKSWLFRIGHNEGLRIIQRRQRTVLQDEIEGGADQSPDASTSAELAERAKALHAAIELLPDHQREVIALRQNDIPFKEIAAITGAPIGTVLARMHKAKHRLRNLLEPILQ